MDNILVHIYVVYFAELSLFVFFYFISLCATIHAE